MKFNKFLLFAVLATAFSACSDPELDPLQYDKIKKGSILVLRGTSIDNLDGGVYESGVDGFDVREDNSSKNMELTVDFNSDDQSLLSAVDIFVVSGTNRTKVATASASEFKPAEGTNFNRATIKIPHTALINADGRTGACAFKPSNLGSDEVDFVDIEADIVLTDGSVVKASQVVNSSLFESFTLYPAHKVRYAAVGPIPDLGKLKTGVKDKAIASGGSFGIGVDTFMTIEDPLTTFKWEAEDNPNVDGEPTGIKSDKVITAVLTNTLSRKQAVNFSVTPTLSNGCEGYPFLVTVTVESK